MKRMAMVIAVLVCGLAARGERAQNSDVTMSAGAIVRGPTAKKEIAMVFTGHTFAEGGETILDQLARHHAKASFFLTGYFLTNPKFAPLVREIVKAGDYVGPHSNKHLLYFSGDGKRTMLVSHEEFREDLEANLKKIERFGVPRDEIKFFLPAYETTSQTMAAWSREIGLTLINFTPGTRSNADYMEDSDKHFVSSQAIFDSIVKKERQDPHGLNGFILLMHIGSGPGRTDKFSSHFGELMDYLSGKGYRFVRVDKLIGDKDR